MMLGAIALAETASNTCAPLLFNSARACPRACLGIESVALLLAGGTACMLPSAADWCTSGPGITARATQPSGQPLAVL